MQLRANRPRPGLRAATRAPWKMIALGAATLTLAGAGAAAGAAANGGARQSHHVATGAAGMLPTNLMSAFAAIRREQTNSDELPAGPFDAQALGVDAGSSRLVLNVAAVKEWLAPGAQHTCAVWQYADGTGGFGCASNEVALTRGLVTRLGSTMWFGVLPDGARGARIDGPAGGQAVVTNADGGFAGSSGQATSFSYVEPDGVPLTIAPSGAAG